MPRILLTLFLAAAACSAEEVCNGCEDEQSLLSVQYGKLGQSQVAAEGGQSQLNSSSKETNASHYANLGQIKAKKNGHRMPDMSGDPFPHEAALPAVGEKPHRFAFDDLILIKTTSSAKGVKNIKKFWAPFLAELGNQVQVAVSIDVTMENATMNAQHDWSSMPALGNFIYTATEDQKRKLHWHAEHHSPALRIMFKLLHEAAPHALLHVASEKDILKSYPSLAEAAAASANASENRWPHPVSWGYNYASSLMAWKLLKARGLKFDHVWEFQDDVRFKKAQDLLDLVSENKASVDALLVPSKPGKVNQSHWFWTKAASKAYLDATWVPANHSTFSIEPSLLEAKNHEGQCERIHSEVWSTRTSSALLEKMHKWCAGENKCAWNEQFPQTVTTCEGLGISQMARLDLMQGGGGGGGLGYEEEVSLSQRSLESHLDCYIIQQERDAETMKKWAAHLNVSCKRVMFSDPVRPEPKDLEQSLEEGTLDPRYHSAKAGFLNITHLPARLIHEVGCKQAHEMVWHKIVQGASFDNRGWSAVFEADVIFRDDFAARSLELQEQAGSLQADMVFLGHCFEQCHEGIRLGQDVNIALSAHPRCTHGYLTSVTGAQRLIDQMTPLKHAVDEQMMYAIQNGGLRAMSACPPILRQSWQAMPAWNLSHHHDFNDHV